MPRQDRETNKAGGKGPAAAEERDKSQPQPACPVQLDGAAGHRSAGAAGAASTGTRLRSPAGAAHSHARPPRAPGARQDLARGAGERRHPQGPLVALAGACCGAGLGAERHSAAAQGRAAASAGRAAWQADGWQLRFNSASLFSQTNPVGFS